MKSVNIKSWKSQAEFILSQNDISQRYGGVCNLLRILTTAIEDIVAACSGLIEYPSQELTSINFEYFCQNIYDTEKLNSSLVGQCISFLTDCWSYVVEYIHGDAEEHERNLARYKNECLENNISQISSIKYNSRSFITEVIPSTYPNWKYYRGAPYQICDMWRTTFEYRLCRVIRLMKEEHDYIDSLTVLVQAMYLYISLKNEREVIKEQASLLGHRLSEDDTVLATSYAYESASSVIENKLQRFMEYVPSANQKKAERLLAKLIKEGYCDDNYYWNAKKWKKGKSRLALSCLAIVVSERLMMSNRMRDDGTPFNSVGQNDRRYTAWQPFEILFTYDGKQVDRRDMYRQLQNAKEQYERVGGKNIKKAPEMKEIEKNFTGATPSKH